MKLRIIGGILVIAITMPVVFFANNIIFALSVTGVSIVSAYELIRAKKNVPLIFQIIMYASLVFMGFYSYKWGMIESVYYLIAFILIMISTVNYRNLEKFNFTDGSVIFVFLVYIVSSYNSMINIKINYDLELFFYPLLVPIIADIFGYLGGRKFGKHKLIEEISPKKTIEGAAFATIFAALFSFSYLYYFELGSILQISIITALMVVLSQFGDLVASTIKRTYNVKDYGKIIPGHGGIMDRFDSILFSFIVLYIILYFI